MRKSIATPEQVPSAQFMRLISNYSIDPSDAIRHRDVLREYFANDQYRDRFRLEKLISAGANGVAWKLNYVDPTITANPAQPSPVPINLVCKYLCSWLSINPSTKVYQRCMAWPAELRRVRC